MKKANLLFFTFLLAFFFVPSSVFAYEIKTGNSITIKQDEVVNGNLYTTASILNIEGKIEGDLFCAASTVTVNGEVSGDIVCAGNTFNINGVVGGSVRTIGNSININSKINNNLQAVGSSITISKESEIGWDAFVAGEQLNFSGKIDGDLHGGLGGALIEGEVGNDVKLRLGNRNDEDTLDVSSSAIINGNVYYTSGAQGTISNEAKIGGEVKHSVSKQEKKTNNFWNFFNALSSVFAALVVGLVLITALKKPITKTINLIRTSSNSALGYGAIGLFLTPIAALLLMITIIGIPLAIIILLLWAILIYLSKIVFGIFVGKYIIKNLLKNESKSVIWSMIVGVVVVWLFCSLPYVGWILSLAAILWGLGGILLYLKKNAENF